MMNSLCLLIRSSFFFSAVFLFSSNFFIEIHAAELKNNNTVYKVKHSPLYALSVPKSGTHFLMSLLYLLTNKEYTGIEFFFRNSTNHSINKTSFQRNLFWLSFSDPYFKDLLQPILEEEILRKMNYTFITSHMNYADLFVKFSNKHPDFVPFLIIRDLRDMIVSAAHYFQSEIEYVTGPLSLTARIDFILSLRTSKFGSSIDDLPLHAEKAAELLNHPLFLYLPL